MSDSPETVNVSPSPETVEVSPINDGVPHHKLGCQCKVCIRIRNAKASGKPSRKELKLKAEAKRNAKLSLKASLETQVALGVTPNAALAGRVAGMDARQAQLVSNANNFVQTALSKHGITDDRLAEIAAAGMDAFFQKIITDQDGAIVDVINQPDWKSRHAFWRDILMVKKLLGNDSENSAAGSGGLIIITPDAAKVSTGHPPACVCDDCRIAWEEKARHLRRATLQENAIIAPIVEEKAQDVVVESEEDDIGPLSD